MKVLLLSGGMLPTNCYFLIDEKTKKSAVVDPGFYSTQMEAVIQDIGADNVDYILLTHGHFDHMLGAGKVKKQTGAKVVITAADSGMLQDDHLNLAALFTSERPTLREADILVKDGDVLPLGELAIRVIATPGHTVGGCCYQVENAVFTGDTLMRGTIGRSDFPTGNYTDLLASVKKLGELPGDYHVYPGHESETTLAYERENNPFLRMDFYDFDN